MESVVLSYLELSVERLHSLKNEHIVPRLKHLKNLLIVCESGTPTKIVLSKIVKLVLSHLLDLVSVRKL